MFSYQTLEERIPANHPLRKLRALVDGILASMHETFAAAYVPAFQQNGFCAPACCRFCFPSAEERQLVQHIEYNLLYRWFVGLSMDDAMWAATSFGENRERLFSEAVMREFFGKVLALGEWKRLISHEHFTVDGTLIEAWASMKRFVPKDGDGKPPEDGGKNPSVNFKGEKRWRIAMVWSLMRKSHRRTARRNGKPPCGW
jgi:transposase